MLNNSFFTDIRKLLTIILVTFLFLASSCSKDDSSTNTNIDNDESLLLEQYQRAIKDAELAEPYEICRNLTAILDYSDSLAGNGNLKWKGTKDNRRILVVTFTKYASTYINKLGQSDTARYGDIWVTVVPEAKDFIDKLNKNFSTEDLTLRMEQLLGLPPNSGYSHMAELWVNPGDLFRPAPDPEIFDCEAELYFRSNTDSSHVKWFNTTISTIYSGSKPFPWTRLGYTYDWGNPQSEIGLSEFVLKKRSVYEVESVKVLADYFN